METLREKLVKAIGITVFCTWAALTAGMFSFGIYAAGTSSREFETRYSKKQEVAIKKPEEFSELEGTIVSVLPSSICYEIGYQSTSPGAKRKQLPTGAKLISLVQVRTSDGNTSSLVHPDPNPTTPIRQGSARLIYEKRDNVSVDELISKFAPPHSSPCRPYSFQASGIIKPDGIKYLP